jgi:hypothetical protein
MSPAAAAVRIEAGIQRCPERYNHAGDPCRSLGRRFQRVATGRSGTSVRERQLRRLGVRRCDTDQPAEFLAHVSEVQARIEILHQVENIALGAALWIPPAVSVVVDDQDLALAAAVFQGATGAFPAIEPPAGGLALQNHSATYLTAKQLELRVIGSHGLPFLWGLVALALCHRSPRAFCVRRPRSSCGARAKPASPAARHTARPLRRSRHKR